MARPSKYNYELCVEICEQVADGNNIKVVLNSKDIYPTFPTWCKWKRENNELFNLYVMSIQDKAESVDQEIDLIMNDLRSGEIDYQTANVMIQTLKWKAAKYYPKMYGNNSTVKQEGSVVVKNVVLDQSDIEQLTRLDDV